MANRKRNRKPRPELFWHVIPLGCVRVNDFVPFAAILDLLQPLLIKAILYQIHSYPPEFGTKEYLLEEKPFLRRCQRHPRDWCRLRFEYQIKPFPSKAKSHKERRNFGRRRVLSGWIGQGNPGQVALFIRRKVDWKDGRYLVGFNWEYR